MSRRLALLISAAALLAAYVLLGEGGLLRRFVQPTYTALKQSEPKTSVESKSEVRLNPLEGLDPSAFAAIIERPLFNPSRSARPPEIPSPPPLPTTNPEAEPQNIGPSASDYKLLGVSTGLSGRIAVVRLIQTNEVVFVRRGQQVQSWTVLAVGPRSISIGTKDNKIELEMFETAAEVMGEEPIAGDSAATPPLDTPAQPSN